MGHRNFSTGRRLIATNHLTQGTNFLRCGEFGHVTLSIRMSQAAVGLNAFGAQLDRSAD